MAQNKPWDGRFTEKNDPVFEKMNRSLDFDIRLYKEDILLNKVYSKELNRLGLISDKELKVILEGLKQLEKDIDVKGKELFGQEIEDIHMGIEKLLYQKNWRCCKKHSCGKKQK